MSDSRQLQTLVNNKWADACRQRSFHSAGRQTKRSQFHHQPASIHFLTHWQQQQQKCWKAVSVPLIWKYSEHYGMSNRFLPSCCVSAGGHISSLFFRLESKRLLNLAGDGLSSDGSLFDSLRLLETNTSFHIQNNFMHKLDKFSIKLQLGSITASPALTRTSDPAWVWFLSSGCSHAGIIAPRWLEDVLQ